MNRMVKKALLALGAAAALTGGVALAQQPQPQPGQPLRPSQGAPAQPMQRPPLPGGQQLPGGHPAVPGMQRPGRPGLPPGFDPHAPGGRRPMPGRPAPMPRPAQHQEEEHKAAHHCPGHGPDDPPPHMNLWRGIFMADMEKSQRGGIWSLLYRYENPKDPCDPKNEPPPFLASLINFGIVAFVLYRYGKKPLAEALVKRKQAIMADIDTATKLKEAAESRLDEYEEKLENMEDKLEEVRAEYKAQAEVEKKHLLAEAEERRVRMRRDAEFRIEQELKAARAELLREAVENAVAAAEDLVAKQIAAKDLDKMSADYLASIGPSLSGVR